LHLQLRPLHLHPLHLRPLYLLHLHPMHLHRTCARICTMVAPKNVGGPHDFKFLTPPIVSESSPDPIGDLSWEIESSSILSPDASGHLGWDD
jgi:hypothetical protein